MEKTFKITGMHCTSCEVLIKDALEDTGVKVNEISSKKGLAIVNFDGKKITESDIKTTIEAEGYKVVN